MRARARLLALVLLALVLLACAHLDGADRAELALNAAAETFTAWSEREAERIADLPAGPEREAAAADLAELVARYNDLEAAAEIALDAYRAHRGDWSAVEAARARLAAFLAASGAPSP